MATNIKDYSTTQADNTSLNTINVAEGMLPSNLNNAIRALMKNTRDWFNDAQWIEYGDGSGSYTATYVSATAFTIDGSDVTSIYHAKRRIQVVDSASTIYGTIASTSFSTNTTVNVTWDSTTLTSGAITSVYLGVLTNTNDSIPTGINAAKLADGTVSNTELQYINSVSSNVQTQIDAKITTSDNLTDIAALANTNSNFIVGDGSNFVAETGSTARTSLGLGTVATQASNSIAITGGSITGMSAPSSGSDVTTKTYVDDLVVGLRSRIIDRVATTGNIDLTSDLQNGDTIDGVTLVTDDKVLVKDQTDQTENGVYVAVASGTASRDPDYDTVAELAGQLVIIQEGTTNADTIYLCTTDSSGTIGVTSITFSQVQPQFTGTVTSVGLADAGSSEFTVANTPITTSGNITLAVNSISGSKITDAVVNDTSPSLGGNLDMNSKDIVTTSNADIELAPNGTGATVLKGNTNAGAIKFNCESNAHAVTLKGPAHSAAATYTLTLPTTNGATDEFLQTDGDGVLTWAAASEVNPAITSFTPTAVAATVDTTVTITGTNFTSIPKIEFQTAAGVVSYAPTVSFTSATTIAFTTGTSTLTNGTNVYLIVTNPDGEAVRSSTLLTVSASPTWDTTTLADTETEASVSYNLDTTADSAATIQTSVVSGALPSGVTIGSTTNPSGTTWRAVLSGTMPAISVETAYSFTLRVTDAESQTADQAFTLTSTVGATGGGQFN
jgi:hypothetical protein